LLTGSVAITAMPDVLEGLLAGELLVSELMDEDVLVTFDDVVEALLPQDASITVRATIQLATTKCSLFFIFSPFLTIKHRTGIQEFNFYYTILKLFKLMLSKTSKMEVGTHFYRSSFEDLGYLYAILLPTLC
jgi:hypothetical protein